MSHQHQHDIVLTVMESDGDDLTPDFYCRMNYGLSWEELQQAGDYVEWESEVRDLIEDGELFDGEDGEYTLAIEGEE